ncbi:MAG: glycoside hydrolase family 130 protein [Bacteroidota bacterium]
MKYTKSDLVAYRQDLSFLPNEDRVITKLFGLDKMRIYKVFDRVLKMTGPDSTTLLNNIITSFKDRHKNIKRVFKNNFDTINGNLDITIYNELPLDKKLLLGSFFTLEYSIESAALFNPSVVPHPNQNNTKKGEKKVIISFRAVGEGHMSSIVFRSGTLDKTGDIRMDKMSHLVEMANTIETAEYLKKNFAMKLNDIGKYDLIKGILDQLLDEFTFDELVESIAHFRANTAMTVEHDRAIDTLHWLAQSNYQVEFDDDIDLTERVIFPRSTTDVRAIEDARFVYFEEDKNDPVYYATYTAYNGFSILPQLIETKDFCRFKVCTMMGIGSQNKGMALFPEKINGKFAMISRNDSENMYIMYSDDINYWVEPKLLREPKFEWEFIQIGNSGSPLKTEKGWLLLTHGVGPVRLYSIGAILLDLNNPSKVIGEIREPILIPEEEERNGYVPNVVYSCGAIIHNGWLVMPYAASDSRSSIAKYKLTDLLDKMVPVE